MGGVGSSSRTPSRCASNSSFVLGRSMSVSFSRIVGLSKTAGTSSGIGSSRIGLLEAEFKELSDLKLFVSLEFECAALGLACPLSLVFFFTGLFAGCLVLEVKEVALSDSSSIGTSMVIRP
ncbi:hypothetical protein WICPIJ_008134 [Wickerhamomyces pijperi]|uniref:Uncharacterized protein n=1 Tax=Wickerhamomyces pijperi TaxID=599730 RepID=A0A9P8PYY9_WICPI|nr:hypothetical protein WICPIJ_008134 [Wickerhamomyces pijperi]